MAWNVKLPNHCIYRKTKRKIPEKTKRWNRDLHNDEEGGYGSKIKTIFVAADTLELENLNWRYKVFS